mmetsp:Transcript_21366/g.43930  ORF Transcript_21366/g.43930 Transcript_21366/m.43930 type:complete len:108 (-) Transcript_21366:606-929(-)
MFYGVTWFYCLSNSSCLLFIHEPSQFYQPCNVIAQLALIQQKEKSSLGDEEEDAIAVVNPIVEPNKIRIEKLKWEQYGEDPHLATAAQPLHPPAGSGPAPRPRRPFF